ncbi:MAG TPA: exodeoxyribonuclease V subunit alpha, partial [Deltaproteobacteria bacterium]|nr:exodeoxyribonuclease V subunit alpha [Deltaproteobacteria bacterium]
MSGNAIGEWPRVESARLLEMARANGVLSALDQQFSLRLAALYGEKEPGIHWALAIASRQEAAGHVCADLSRLVADGLVVERHGETEVHPLLATSDSLEDWLAELRESPLVSLASSRGSERGTPRPLVLDERGRLYLRRAHGSQSKLAERIRERAGRDDLDVDRGLAETGIERLMDAGSTGLASDEGDREDEAPRSALRVALSRPLAIVTGGPGTGKTTLVSRLVVLLIEQALAKGRSVPRVRLLAPTGKAAAAMAASFARQRESLDLPDGIREALPRTAETIHRALHPQTRLDAFGRPLPFSLADDIVIVDEASMVDLELMARLFDACRDVERLVLLGDPDQLTSVQAG